MHLQLSSSRPRPPRERPSFGLPSLAQSCAHSHQRRQQVPSWSSIPHRVRNWTELGFRQGARRTRSSLPWPVALASHGGGPCSAATRPPTRTREEAVRSSLETASSDHPHAHAGRSQHGGSAGPAEASPPRARGKKRSIAFACVRCAITPTRTQKTPVAQRETHCHRLSLLQAATLHSNSNSRFALRRLMTVTTLKVLPSCLSRSAAVTPG